jgi:hypothetical protein
MNDMSGLSGVEAFSHDDALPEASDHMDHAVFGRLLIDLGYKKVYASSARSITTNVPIWSLQVRVRTFEEGKQAGTQGHRDAGTRTPGYGRLSSKKG